MITSNTLIANVIPIILLIIFSVIWTADKWPANQEIKKAMQNGKVNISGNKFSLSHPLTFEIEKNTKPPRF